MTKIITRKDAKEHGLTRYYTGKSCKYGHTLERFTSTGICIECSRLACSEWRENNKEIANIQKKNWSSRNINKVKLYKKKWNINNRTTLLTKNAKRRAARLKATPPWADQSAIREIYEEAERLTRKTGIKHHVDHIFPLKGENSCGLHIPENLEVRSEFENLSKGNSLPFYFLENGRIEVLTNM